MFVTSEGHPGARLQRALAVGNLIAAERKAQVRGAEASVLPRRALIHQNEGVRLRLPLIFFNTGATALTVTDLRISLDGDPTRSGFDWITTRSTLRPSPEDGHRFATPFAVRGREAREVIAEFGDDDGWSPPAGSRHRMRVQAMVSPSEEWDDVGAFDWWSPPSDASTRNYIAHRNVSPDSPQVDVDVLD